MTIGTLKILRIEIDGHWHGSSDVPKPWVAQITGIDRKYGLARNFLDPMHDWSGAKRAISGNLYGRVARFALREGNLYEVWRARGNSSKRHMAREFIAVRGGKTVKLEPSEALAAAERCFAGFVEYIVPDGTRIARVEQLGTPATCGFVVVGSARDERLYHLRERHLHEVSLEGHRHLLLVESGSVRRVTQPEALAWLSAEIGAAA